MKYLFAMIILSLVSSGRGQNYEVTGDLNERVLNPIGVVFTNYHCSFSVSVDSEKWFIRSEYAPNYFVEYGSDGQMVCTVLYDPDQPDVELGRPGMVSSGTFPFSADPKNAVIWLALGSCTFFKQYTNDMVPVPWSNPLSQPDAFIYSCRRTFLVGGLPSTLKWTVLNSLLKSALKNEVLPANPSGFLIDALSHYKPGFEGGEYSVSATTNFAGLEIPLHFRLRRYDLGGGVFEDYEGGVTGISRNSRSAFLPEVNGVVGVADHRFKDKQHGMDMIRYSLTNAAWPAKGEGWLLPVYDESRAYALGTYRRPVSTKTPVILFFCLIFVIPPLFMASKWWLKKKRIEREGNK